MTIREQMTNYAKSVKNPVVLHEKALQTVYFPSGEFMTVNESRTIPRNQSRFVTPDAIKSPGMLIKRANDMCQVWYAWFDGSLHGQFHSEQDAINAMMA